MVVTLGNFWKENHNEANKAQEVVPVEDKNKKIKKILQLFLGATHVDQVQGNWNVFIKNITILGNIIEIQYNWSQFLIIFAKKKQKRYNYILQPQFMAQWN